MGKGVVGIIFISLFILFGSVAFIMGIIPEGEGPPEGGDEGGTTCTDSDVTGAYPDGKNYGVRGECNDATGFTPVYDSCNQSNTVNEYFCSSWDVCAIEYNVACEGDCVDGACLTGCTENEDCTGNQPFCHPDTKDCVGCIIDGHCNAGLGETCVGNVCVTSSGLCTDTDVTGAYPDGKNYNLRGTTTGTDGVPRTDVCTGGDMLLEYYCSGGDAAYPEDDWECPLGCSEGACITPIPPAGSCEIIYLYSNRSTLTEGNNMAIFYDSGTITGWTAVIPQARWIWEETRVGNPEINTTVIFTKTFNVNDNGGTISGVLDIATDNSYSCTLNGVVVGDDASENNFRVDTQDTYSLTNIVVGVNTLVCTVKNWEQPGGTWDSNPAGLLYGLSIYSGDCDTSCLDTDGGVNYLSPGTASTDIGSSTDSCSADESSLTEYYCANGAITSIEYSCDCIDDGSGGYCLLSGVGMACEAFSSLSGEDPEGIVDDEIQNLLGSPDLVGLTLSDAPVRSKVENEIIGGDTYYCGLDLLWHRVKPNVQDIGCINNPSLDCISNVACLDASECYSGSSCVDMAGAGETFNGFCDYNTACLEDYECLSNSCVDSRCISISAELIAQRSILTKIWCVVTNLPSYISDGEDSLEYLLCMEDAFGGV